MRRAWAGALAVALACLALLACGVNPPAEVGEGGDNVLVTPLALHDSDSDLQRDLERTLRELDLQPLVDGRRMGVALVDLSSPDSVRYAGVNDDVMFYAASLPKIAVLLTAFEKVEAGDIADTPALRRTLTDMIRVSSNSAATSAIGLVGFEAIAETLQKPRYRFYDERGGLWVGKAYDPAPAVRRDPLFDLSHGATARQAARFFAMLDRGLLVSADRSREMLGILGDPGIRHKFVKGLAGRPGATIHRKSGTFRHYHADAALVDHDGHRFVAAALVEDAGGGAILEQLIQRLDDIIVQSSTEPQPTGPLVAKEDL